ncbi:hypothetical protein FRC09_018937, partial [Ceratobasidium sp. 395]
DLIQSVNISLLSINHKYHIKGTVHKTKFALQALDLPPPLQLNHGCKFRFQDGVNQATSLIV